MLDYSKIYDPDFGYDSIISDETAAILKDYIKPKTTILDVGCGTGRVSSNFLNNKITLIEKHEEYLKQAQKKINNPAIFKGDVLDYKDSQKFHNILLLNFIHEQPSIERIIKKIKSLLIKNGLLFITYPNSESLHRLIGSELDIIENTSSSVSSKAKTLGTLRMISDQEIENILKNFDLEIIDKKGICFKPYPNHIMEKLEDKLINELNQLSVKFPDLSSMKLLVIKN